MSENTTRRLYMFCNIYAWSNSPKKPPRFGRKWTSDISKSKKRKKYLWNATIVVWTDGGVGIMDPVLATESEIERMNMEK